MCECSLDLRGDSHDMSVINLCQFVHTTVFIGPFVLLWHLLIGSAVRENCLCLKLSFSGDAVPQRLQATSQKKMTPRPLLWFSDEVGAIELAHHVQFSVQFCLSQLGKPTPLPPEYGRTQAVQPLCAVLKVQGLQADCASSSPFAPYLPPAHRNTDKFSFRVLQTCQFVTQT